MVDDPPSALLATGPVVGVLHRNEVWHAWLFRATDFCWAAVESLEKSHPYEVEAAVAFLDGAPDRPRAAAAARAARRAGARAAAGGAGPGAGRGRPRGAGATRPGEHHLPYDFARTPGSLARGWFTDEEMDRSLDFLAARAGGGRRLAGQLARVGTRDGAGGPPDGDARGAADPAGVRAPAAACTPVTARLTRPAPVPPR